jgi:transposase-like protein
VKKTRKHFTAEQKAAVVREHLVDRKPVSELCEEQGIRPTVFYRWQKQVFDALPGFFERSSERQTRHFKERVATLEDRLARKDEVIAEITEDYIAAKKKTGDR